MYGALAATGRPPGVAVLQLDWVVDAAPGWLAPGLFVAGTLLLASSTVYEVTATSGVFGRPLVAAVGFPVLMAGSLAGLFATRTWLFVVVVTFVGRWIEGVAAIRLYRRVHGLVRSGRLRSSLRRGLARLGSGSDGESTTGRGHGTTRVATGFDDRIALYAAGLCLPLVGVWVAVALVAFGPLSGSLSYDLRVVWTLVTLGTAVLGLTRKLRPLNDVVATPILAGIVLTVASTEVYNLALGADLLAHVVGGIGYFAGYWVAVHRVVSGEV